MLNIIHKSSHRFCISHKAVSICTMGAPSTQGLYKVGGSFLSYIQQNLTEDFTDYLFMLNYTKLCYIFSNNT